MPAVILDHATDVALGLAADSEGISKGELVARMVAELEEAPKQLVPAPAPESAPAANQEPVDSSASNAQVDVHFTYQQLDTSGLFDRATQHLTVTNGSLVGRVFKTPSGAAKAVVIASNSTANPSRNGWAMWTVTATGEPLQSLRGRMPNQRRTVVRGD